ncbi:glycosyltransferase family 2 protein [Streptomyces boninensis]|uniref:glycosyltransferase family 2 protein n=1 Tax=Streptomyces boninensis TaxID=2039455 RepID=UPI003B216537
MSDATVSLVVPSRNEGERLADTIERFLETSPGKDVSLAEIIVVDDQSSDGSANNLPQDRVTVLRPPSHLGVAKAKNFGTTAASGDIVVWSDAHVVVPPGWAAEMSRILAAPDVGVVSPGIAGLEDEFHGGYGGTWKSKDASLRWEWLPKRIDGKPYEVPLLPGGFMAMRRTSFMDIGGFDSGLGTWGDEDAEISLRTWAFGLRCMVIPGVTVRHNFTSSGITTHVPALIYNKLRMAVLHLPDDEVEAVIDKFRRVRGFAESMSRIITGDTLHRRADLDRRRKVPRSWLIEKFNLHEVFSSED